MYSGYGNTHNVVILWILSGINVIVTPILLITRSQLSIAQANFSFKCLDKYTFMYTTSTFIIEVLHLITQVQLLLTTVTVN